MATISIADNDARIQHSIGSSGNTASSTQFTIDYPFFSLDDINVTITNSAGVDTALSRGTGTNTFSVAGTVVDDGFSGGYIILNTQYTSSTVTITRDIPISRTSDFATSGPFNISSLNTELDKIYAVMQQIETNNDRSLTMPDSDALTAITLPGQTSRLGTVLGFNASTGQAEVGPTIANVNALSAITANINTVGGIASNVTTVAGIQANVSTVAGISSNVSSVAGNATNINTVAGKASLITSDFASDMALIDSTFVSKINLVTSDFVTDMAVVTSDFIADLNSLATTAIIADLDLLATSEFVSDLNAVEGIKANVTTVAGIASNVTSVAGNSSNINSAVSNASNINSAVSNASNINSAVSNASNINSAVSNASNINTVAGAITNVNNVGGAITNINTVASNVSGVNSFAARYRVQSGVPSSDNDVGDLVFDTSASTLKVFGASGFQNAGSSVNGTSARFHYDIGSAVTSVTGNDAAGNTLAYDAGFIDVYVNGVRMSTADVTVTSGDTVTFASALASGDEVDIVAFGTFAVANIVSTGALNSGSITSGFGTINNGASAITTTGAISGGSLAVDNITIDGTEIDLSSGDLTIDVEGKIALDANDDGSIKLQDNGTEYARIDGNSSNLRIISQISDKDIIFNGNDGGSAITALTLDMSDGGRASFGHNADFVDGRGTRFGAGQDLQIYHDGSNSYINDTGTGSLIIRSNRHRIQSDGGENVIEAHADGAVELYYDTSKKLETTTTGVNITGAVNIGGTGTANALSDYEEGNYTVTFTCSVSGTITLKGANNQASYTKVGRLVHVSGYIVVESVSSPNGYFRINLPFTPANLPDTSGFSSVNFWVDGINSGNAADFVGYVSESDAQIYVQLGDAVSVQNDSANQMKANTAMILSVSYHTT